ncbi:type I secretion C-terminal target domain-containing protein [Vibrio sp. JC009]|uniref:type I secretion C-terminal target domain-containing protein n=1 Tax=Vibrio sp. JC009 TaxID=2912314 RepID=UPI0023AEAB96|nr:type I secretion C-terminal target domain-containing protein [Vibrio sp. JC009]WED23141.1 type I secretion C-terminal target domain-containing protein [Vibrio sp. JC009]
MDVLQNKDDFYAGDILTGGEGPEVFIWSNEDLDGSVNTISDFTIASGSEDDPDYVEGDVLDFSDLLTDMSEEEIGDYLKTLPLYENDDGTGLELVLSHGDDSVTIVFEGYTADNSGDLLNYIVQQNSIIVD